MDGKRKEERKEDGRTGRRLDKWTLLISLTLTQPTLTDYFSTVTSEFQRILRVPFC